jgi:hypothetical protein
MWRVVASHAMRAAGVMLFAIWAGNNVVRKVLIPAFRAFVSDRLNLELGCGVLTHCGVVQVGEKQMFVFLFLKEVNDILIQSHAKFPHFIRVIFSFASVLELAILIETFFNKCKLIS